MIYNLYDCPKNIKLIFIENKTKLMIDLEIDTTSNITIKNLSFEKSHIFKYLGVYINLQAYSHKYT